jgi:hypothetical protein
MTRRKPKKTEPEVAVGVALRNDEGEIWSSREFVLHSDLLELATGMRPALKQTSDRLLTARRHTLCSFLAAVHGAVCFI